MFYKKTGTTASVCSIKNKRESKNNVNSAKKNWYFSKSLGNVSRYVQTAEDVHTRNYEQ